jgi:STE24 endopeptidase
MRASAVAVRESAVARVIAAAIAMLGVAELAVLLLAPGADIPQPVPVAATDFLAPDIVAQAVDYRDGQRWLMLAGVALELVVLGAVALGRPRGLRRRLERLRDRPYRGAALAGAGVAIAIAIVGLPTGIWAHERAVDVGISHQPLGSWLWDLGRSAAISAALFAIGAMILIALLRRFGRRWWVPGAGAVALIAIVFVWIAPVVLSPVFNRFEPLPDDSPARERVLALADRAGVDVGEVYAIDASRRVSSLNAYVDGLGPTKRVVLYDNLIERAEQRALASVVAHELGHVANDDLPRGIAYIAIVAPLGLLFVRELGGGLARRSGAGPTEPAAIPAYLFALVVATVLLNVPGSQLSREVEAAADHYALELTGNPQGLIELQTKLARANLTDPDPPGAVRALLSTHPSTVERIGAALAFERERER